MNTAKRLMEAILFAAITLGAGCMNMDNMPNPPSNLTVMELSGGGHLTWKDNSDNESSFMIERKDGAGSFVEITTVPFDTTAYHDTPLVVGTTYAYRVMAMPKSGGHTGEMKYSNEASFVFMGL